MKPYTIPLEAGVRLPFNVGGEYFLLESAPLGGVDVEFYGANNVKRDQSIEDGQSSDYARIRGGFVSIALKSAQAQTVKFYLATGEMGRNVFSGSSDVTDRAARLLGIANLDPEDARYFLFGDDETADGEAFINYSSAGPVAAQNAIVQLFNPAASGKVLYVDAAYVNDRTAADSFELRQHNVALVALIATGLKNKNINGAAGVAQLRAGAAAGGAGTVLSERAVNVAGLSSNFDFKAPLRVPEGWGVHITSFTVNHLITATFHWREKAA